MNVCRVIGQVHYQTARATQKLLQDYKGLQDIIAILGEWRHSFPLFQWRHFSDVQLFLYFFVL